MSLFDINTKLLFDDGHCPKATSLKEETMRELFGDISDKQWDSRFQRVAPYGFSKGISFKFFLFISYLLDFFFAYGEKCEWKCEICGKFGIPTGHRFEKLQVMNIDHDHDTGLFRGCICNKDNVALFADGVYAIDLNR